MRRLPAPALPPPPPPPNNGARASDSPKLGEERLPTGVARFTRLKTFWKLMDTLRLYRFSLGAAPPPPCGPSAATFAPAPPPPAARFGPPGPPAGRLSPPPPVAAWPAVFAATALPPLITPKAKLRLTRKLTTNDPGA